MIKRFFSIWLIVLTVVSATGANTWQKSFFEINLKSNSVYTPGKMELFLKLTDKAVIEGQYIIRLSIFVADTLTREQVIALKSDWIKKFDMLFPAVRDRTEVRCRTELFIDDQFIQAKEFPLTLWPAHKAIEPEDVDNHIWLFDVSGRLQNIFQKLKINYSDALFQSVREFEKPRVIFIGEDVGPEKMKIIDDLLSMLLEKKEPITVVFLKQSGFLAGSNVQIAGKDKYTFNITCDPNSSLLDDLNKLDIMDVSRNSVPLNIEEPEENDRTTDSVVYNINQQTMKRYHYLLVLDKAKQRIVYCQFPILVDYFQNPRSGILLRNVIKFANPKNKNKQD